MYLSVSLTHSLLSFFFFDAVADADAVAVVTGEEANKHHLELLSRFQEDQKEALMTLLASVLWGQQAAWAPLQRMVDGGGNKRFFMNQSRRRKK